MRVREYYTLIDGRKPLRLADSSILRKIDKSGDGIIDLSEIRDYITTQGILGGQDIPPAHEGRVVQKFINFLVRPPSPKERLYPIGYDAYVKRMQSLCAKYPKHAQLVELGKVHPQVALHALRITWDIGRSTTTPTFLFVSGLHGREWAPLRTASKTAKSMLIASGGPKMADRLMNAEVWFVMAANPIGYNVSRLDIFRQHRSNWHIRKLSNSSSSETMVSWGADLNRNFGTAVFSGDRENLTPFIKHHLKDQALDAYRGPHPGSEKETQLLANLILELKPVGLMDTHAYGNYFVCPWLTTTDPVKERQYRQLVRTLSKVTGFDDRIEMTPAPGMLIDYAADASNGTLSLLTEIGTTEQSDYAELKRLLRVVPRMNIAFIDFVLEQMINS